jgi:fructose-1,6-bisphosphatase/inositol monophosphatase family enzyme
VDWGVVARKFRVVAVGEPAFSAAIHTFEDLRRVGGASLDLCWTAEGVFDRLDIQMVLFPLEANPSMAMMIFRIG